MNFNASRDDFETIIKICERLEAARGSYTSEPRIARLMDLTACHLNGCQLQLTKLLDAEIGDFLHDVMGITRHINRETGQLEDCFVPRYAARQAVAA